MHPVADSTSRHILVSGNKGDLDGVHSGTTERCSNRSSDSNRRDQGGVQRPTMPTSPYDENRSTRDV